VALWADHVVDTATGIMLIHRSLRSNSGIWDSVATNFGLSYLSVLLSLNVLLTLTIVIRLVLHSRNIRSVMGAPPGLTGLYKAVVTMLIESSAIYAVSSLLFLGFWGSGCHVAEVASAILAETQVYSLSPSVQTWLSDVIIGHCSIAHHTTSRQSEGIDEQKHRLRKYRFDQL